MVGAQYEAYLGVDLPRRKRVWWVVTEKQGVERSVEQRVEDFGVYWIEYYEWVEVVV